MRELMAVCKALSDAQRIRTLLLLQQGEMCVCEVVAALGLAPSTVSRHLAVLERAGLVVSRKLGRWVHYRLAGPDAPPVVADALDWVLASVQKKPLAVKFRCVEEGEGRAEIEEDRQPDDWSTGWMD